MWVAFPPPPRAARTELLVHVVDEFGAPARLARADVYFDSWGGGDVIPIPHHDNTVRIGLDRASACALEPNPCANHPVFFARILLEAEGFAPISSDLFDWMGEAGSSNESTHPICIRFPGAAPIRIAAGTQHDVTIRFRNKRPRRLRVVDLQGRPVAGAHVTVKSFYADTNHKAVFEGDVLLENRPTDGRGDLAIPDGDIVYGVDIDKRHWEIVRPRSRSWPNQFFQRIQGPTLTVVMRQHARVPLLLRFARDGVAVVGLTVSACVTPCIGACCGPIGTTDNAGNLTVNDFYPEEYDRVLVPKSEDAYKALWEIDPRTLRQPRRRLPVALPR